MSHNTKLGRTQMLSAKETELLRMLAVAEKEFRQLGDKPIWSSYKSGPDIADFIASASSQIQTGKIDSETSRELWSIFALTCDWDNVVGDAQFGNTIFEILCALYKPKH